MTFLLKVLKTFTTLLITFMVSTTFVFAQTAHVYGQLLKAKSTPIAYEKAPEFDALIEHLNGLGEVELEEEEETQECYKKGEVPPRGEEDRCCPEFQYYGGKCDTPPEFSRKKCDDESLEYDNAREPSKICPDPTEACMRSDVEDMFGGTLASEASDNELEKKIAKRENGFWSKLFKPRANGKTCSNDKRCETWNCTKIPKRKNGKIKRKKNGKIKYKWMKRCKPLYLCRCVNNGEKAPHGGAKCCPGLKKDVGEYCRDPNAFGVLYPNDSPIEAGMDPVSCAVNVPPLALYNYLKDTYKLRAFEWLYSTAGNTDDCFGFAPKLKALAESMRLKRIAIVAAFQAELDELKRDRNELVNKKFSAHRAMANEDTSTQDKEVAVAVDRMTGKAMILLMKKEQTIMTRYEQTLAALFKDIEPKLETLKVEWESKDPDKKHKKDCRGFLSFSKKNKKRWKHRFKVKDRQSNANSEAVKNDAITEKMKDLTTTDARTIISGKKVYFLNDPLMPGNKTFKEYGQSFLRKGKYRRTLGKPGFWLMAIVTVLTGGVLLIPALVGTIVARKRASKKEKTFLSGVRQNFSPDISDYFQRPEMKGDLELGIDTTCLATDFKESEAESYQEDIKYEDSDEYFERAPASEEDQAKQEEVQEENEEEIDEFADFEQTSNEGVRYENGKRRSSKSFSKKTGAQKCARTAVAITEISNSAFAQFWLYSYSKKRKYENFGSGRRTQVLTALTIAFKKAQAHLGMMANYRLQSITCLDNKLKEFDWGREGGIISEADKYNNEGEDIEWQKSKQADLDCKNCNLKGQGGTVGFKARKIGTSSISGNVDAFNTIKNPLISTETLDIKKINKNYAAYLASMKKKNAEILKKDPDAKARSELMLKSINAAIDPSAKGVAFTGGFDLETMTLKKSSRDVAGENEKDKKQESPKESKMILDSGEAAKLALAQKNTSKKNKKNKKDLKKNLKGLFGDSDEIFADLEEAREKTDGKSLTGLTTSDEQNILTNISNKGVADRSQISTDSLTSLFDKVSKAYVREALPRLLSRRKKGETKRKPSSKKSSLQQQLLNKFKQLETN
jgi:hypothetical protein